MVSGVSAMGTVDRQLACATRNSASLSRSPRSKSVGGGSGGIWKSLAPGLISCAVRKLEGFRRMRSTFRRRTSTMSTSSPALG